MRRNTWRAAITLCAAASLATALGPASASPAAAPSGAHGQVTRQAGDTVLVDCFWKPQVRPGDFILACGDGNSRLTSMHWTHWESGSAVGTGYNAVNDCKPYCAAGKFHSYPVIVVLERPKTWKRSPATQQYGQMSIVYPDSRPDGYERVVTYPMWN